MASNKMKFVIENVHIIDGTGKEMTHKNVLIKNGVIEKIQDSKIFSFHAKKIDGTGKTLMPGLIDSHMHMQGISNRSEEESDDFLRNRVPSIFKDNLFPYGITTIKDLGSPRHFSYKLREMIENGKIRGPKFLMVGPNITAKGGHPEITLGGDNPWIRKELAAVVNSERDARDIVKELADNGVDFLKIVYQGGQYFYFDQELNLNKLDLRYVNIIIEEAKKYGLKVTAHVRNKADVEDLLTTKLYGIEHGITNEDITGNDMILDLWKQQGAYYVPTLHALFLEHDKTLFGHGMHNLKFIYDKGIPIALGTDNMLEFLSGDVVHKELSYYVEAGLTPMQALVTATGMGAKYLQIEDRTGTVEVGKDADLILLDKNPLEDIKNVQCIQMVWKEGICVYERGVQSVVKLPDYPINDGTVIHYQDNLISGKNKQRSYQLNTLEDGLKIRLDVTENKATERQEVFTTSKNLVMKEWTFVDEAAGSKLYGVLRDQEVVLTGVFRKKEVNKTYDLKGMLWMQMGEFNLLSFILSDAQEIHYHAIGTGEGRGALEMTEFTSKKAGIETISVDQKEYECMKVLTVITKYSFIWTGIGWYDMKSGNLIKYATKGKEKDMLYVLR